MSAIIDEIVALIRGARYGRDVRESIAHGIEVIDDVAEGARDSATASATDAQNYAHNADQSASNAHTSEVNANASATTAIQKATLSESWAVGGTGTRTGEDTNNAKYWSEQAQGAVTGVTSFNGRIGAVVPTSGDYNITQIDGSGTAGKVAVTDGNGHMILTNTGQANGIASLDANGRIPYTQLPESAMEFKGTWNASTNTPTLTSGVGDSGDFYVVSVGGTWNNIDFNVNDRIVFDGVTAHDWIRLVAGEVNSVNGQSGQVLLDAEDIPFSASEMTSTDVENAIRESFAHGGHKIYNESGTLLTQRDNLQFVGLNTNDDGTKTVVSSRIFTGTTNEWNALTSAEKAKYEIVNLTDDGETGEVVDAVTDGDMRPVTSNAVADVFANTIVCDIAQQQRNTWTFNIPTAYRGMLIICDSSTSYQGLYIVASTSVGALQVSTVFAASSITLVTDVAKELTLNFAQTTGSTICFVDFFKTKRVTVKTT